MFYLTSVILITALIAEVTLYDGLTVGKLPTQIAEELEYIFKHAQPDLKPNCTEIREPQIKFLLYNRENTNTPITLNPSNPTEINPRKKILLVLHGWLQNSTSSGISQLKDAYLNRYNCDLIIVDWSEMAFQPYTTSFCHVPRMGEIVADFLCVLNQLKVRLDMLHVVGHSLGGQIAGYAGKYLKKNCNTRVWRITGLDPSGPQFSYKAESVRLAPGDAEFIDVIHTDGFNYGYYLTCGDVDFYPNCGIEQPGCPYFNKIEENTLVSDVLCKHHRSLELMTESISSEDLIAVSCAMCPRHCSPVIVNEVYTAMGENCRSVPRSTKFLIPTNGSPPYGKGMDPYSLSLNKTVLCKNAPQSPSVLLRKVCNVH